MVHDSCLNLVEDAQWPQGIKCYMVAETQTRDKFIDNSDIGGAPLQVNVSEAQFVKQLLPLGVNRGPDVSSWAVQANIYKTYHII